LNEPKLFINGHGMVLYKVYVFKCLSEIQDGNYWKT